jgi:hypothetical protein
VQHVALHEGLVSGILDKNRSLLQAEVQVIKSELKEQAENIKQLLMGKIKNNCKMEDTTAATTTILYQGFNTFFDTVQKWGVVYGQYW